MMLLASRCAGMQVARMRLAVAIVIALSFHVDALTQPAIPARD